MSFQQRGGFLAKAASVLFATLIASTALAQYPDGVKEDDFKRAIQFYTEGGSFCFRAVPIKDAEKESEWTVIVFSSKSLAKPSFRIGEIELPKKLADDPDHLKRVGASLNIQIVMNDPKNRAEFFKRFAEGIDSGVLRARLVKTEPLKKGQEVPLSKAVDLKASELTALRDLEQVR